MPKVTGQPIKFWKSQQLRTHAISFHEVEAVKNAVAASDSATQAYYNNLDCAFIFDKQSLQDLIDSLAEGDDAGLIMRLGASLDDSETDADRINKPTLSIFRCTIDPNTNSYQIVIPVSSSLDDVDGVEHPGIIDLNDEGGLGGGTIKFLKPVPAVR